LAAINLQQKREREPIGLGVRGDARQKPAPRDNRFSGNARQGIRVSGKLTNKKRIKGEDREDPSGSPKA